MNIRRQQQSLKGIFLICLTGLFLPALSIQAQNVQTKKMNDAENVRAALARLLDGFNNRDPEIVISSFTDTEDSFILNPTRGIGTYQNLKAGLTKAYAVPTKNPYEILINVEEIQTSGNVALVRLIWLRERHTDKAIVSKERDLEIWQRTPDGKWRLARGYSVYFKEDFPRHSKQ